MRNVIPKDARLIPEQAERVFKGIIFDVYHWQQEMFDGSMATFERLRRPDSVHIIAVKGDQIVMIHEQQPGTDTYITMPAGRHDHEDETELQGAQRELTEETGMTFATWKLLSVVQPQTKIEHFVYTFLASDFLGTVEQKLDPGEKIEVELMSLSEVKVLFGNPKARFISREILEPVSTIKELLALPEYRA